MSAAGAAAFSAARSTRARHPSFEGRSHPFGSLERVRGNPFGGCGAFGPADERCEASHATRPELPAHRLGREAAGLELVLVLATVTLLAKLGPPTPVEQGDWVDFAILLPLVAVAHLLGADRAKHQGCNSRWRRSSRPSLLPPSLFVLLHGGRVRPGVDPTRSDWYIASSTSATTSRPRSSPGQVFDAVDGGSAAGWTLGAVAAIAAFLVLHYGLLAAVPVARPRRQPAGHRALRLRPHRRGSSSLGAIGAALWEDFPGWRADAPADRARVARSRSPRSSRPRGSTRRPAPYNVRHLKTAVAQLGRAARFDRPVALLMVDVDHLRDINTARGHSPATARSPASPRRFVGPRPARTTSRPASAATSSASSSRRRTWRAP